MKSPAKYRIPLPTGRYHIVLHIAEIYHENPEKRRFGVRIEGEKVLESCGASEFASAERRTSETTVSDAYLDIDFVHEIENPSVCAIEIHRLDLDR